MIEEKENALFDEWKQKYTGRGFVRDGVVSEKDHLASDLKICFVLKQANDPDGGEWDLRGLLRAGGVWQTWNNVARWVKGIRDRHGDLAWADYEQVDEAFRQEQLRSICAVNLVKEPGEGSTPPGSLDVRVNEDKKFLKRQFDIYKPDLTVCCGTSDLFAAIVGAEATDWQSTSRGVWWFEKPDGTRVIRYCHPALWGVDTSMLFYPLIDATRELLP